MFTTPIFSEKNKTLQRISRWSLFLIITASLFLASEPPAFSQAASFDCDGEFFYSSGNFPAAETQIDRIQTFPNFGLANQLTASPPGAPVLVYNGLGFRAQDGFFYAIEPDRLFAPPNDRYSFYRISNAATAAAAITEVSQLDLGTPLGRFAAGDVASDGFYYAYNQRANELIQVNPATGARTAQINIAGIPLAPGSRLFDIAFSPGDNTAFYAFADSDLYRVDLTFAGTTLTAANATLIQAGLQYLNAGVPTAITEIGSLFFRPDGSLVFFDNGTGGIVALNGVNPPAVLVNPGALLPANLAQNDGASCTAAPVFEKTVNPTTITAGGVATYTYTIRNPNTFAYQGGNFVDDLRRLPTPLPGGTAQTDGRTFVSGTVNNPGGSTNNPPGGAAVTFSNGNSRLQISNLTVPGNSTVTLTVDVQIPATIAAGTVLQNQSSFSATNPAFPGVNFTAPASNNPLTTVGPSPDPTPLTVSNATSPLGVSKRVVSITPQAGTTVRVVYEITARNLSTVNTINDLQLTENLDTTYGIGSFTIPTPATNPVNTAGGITVNTPNFDGRAAGNINLLTAGQDLLPSASATFTLTVDVDTASANLPNPLPGPFSNQVNGTGTVGGQPVADASNDGTSVDPDGDGNPTEPGENTPTQVFLGPDLRLVKRITNAFRGGVAVPGLPANIGNFNDDLNDGNDNIINTAGIPPVGVTSLATGILQSGDEVEYTIYFHNFGSATASTVELCDVIQLPTTFVTGNNYQFNAAANSVGFAEPQTAPLTFGGATGAARTLRNPGAALDASCVGTGTFPGAAGTIGATAGGGVIVNGFDVAASPGNSFGAIRFRARVP